MNLPLSSVRLLSVEQYGAGPFGSMYLATMGAEVIKIESPRGGDSSRATGPHFLGEADSQFYQTFNQGKRSLTLNLKDPEGQKIFHKLVASADGVMNNLRGDQPARLGLTYSDLSSIRRDIVCLHMSGYGRDTSRASWPAYDYLIQAETGYLALTGEPGAPPQRMGLSIVDYLSGITAAFALASSLYGAKQTGHGQDIDLALFDVALHQLTYPATWYLNAQDETQRRPRSGHPSVVPCELLPTANGHIFVMCVLPKFWQALCTAFDRPDLPHDDRFVSPEARLQNRDALMNILDDISRTKSSEEWMEILAGRVPVAPVLETAAALDNSYLEEIDAIGEVDHPEHPGFKLLRFPIRMNGKRPPLKLSPGLGSDTDDILSDLGYDAEKRKSLRAAGTI